MSMRPIPVTCDCCGKAFHTGTLVLGAQYCYECQREQNVKKALEQRAIESMQQAEFEAQCDGAGGDQALNNRGGHDS